MADPDILMFHANSACGAPAIVNHGGSVASSCPVQLIYWGTNWKTRTDPVTGRLTCDLFTDAVKTILAGPHMAGLRQYGVKRAMFRGWQIVDSYPPLIPDDFDNGDVEDMLQKLIDDGQFPEPDDPGGQIIYMVFMPQNTHHPDSHGIHVGGEHDYFSTGTVVDADHLWYAFVCDGSFDDMIATFCHELVELCTDAEKDAWRDNGAGQECREIGDVCTDSHAAVNGVNNVEAYWSRHDQMCIIPTAWSVRRNLGWSGKKLNGKGLRSLQDPIPSLNKFIVDL